MASLFVDDAGIGTFYLRSASEHGVEVTAEIGSGVPEVVDQTRTMFNRTMFNRTMFNWSPS